MFWYIPVFLTFCTVFLKVRNPKWTHKLLQLRSCLIELSPFIMYQLICNQDLLMVVRSTIHKAVTVTNSEEWVPKSKRSWINSVTKVKFKLFIAFVSVCLRRFECSTNWNKCFHWIITIFTEFDYMKWCMNNLITWLQVKRSRNRSLICVQFS